MPIPSIESVLLFYLPFPFMQASLGRYN